VVNPRDAIRCSASCGLLGRVSARRGPLCVRSAAFRDAVLWQTAVGQFLDENAKPIHDKNVTVSIRGPVLDLRPMRNDEHKGATAEPADAALGEWHYSMT
jgi:hypothetical protein